MSALAEQIAREHWLDAHDECGTCRVGDYAAHIATVTERAVRGRVAEEIEALPAESGATGSGAWSLGYTTGVLDAASIARGESDGRTTGP